jgi:hypothetical protein
LKQSYHVTGLPAAPNHFNAYFRRGRIAHRIKNDSRKDFGTGAIDGMVITVWRFSICANELSVVIKFHPINPYIVIDLSG